MNTRVAFVFPGQGSQSVGMGQAWANQYPEARQAYAEADDALGFAISEMCWSGPESDLQLTANTQPALLATAVAILRVVEKSVVSPVAVAGHSLGEYAALVAAGSLQYSDALRLVRRRGEFMQEAVPVGVGAMAAILGLAASEVAAVTAAVPADEVCTVANLNAPDQTVIAGHTGAVERAVEQCQERGARRAIMLPVSAPFHSPLMVPARENLTPFLEETEFLDPEIPVVSNIDAMPTVSGAAARDALVRQIDGPVRWVESVIWLADQANVELFVEVGPGRVLAGLNRRIAPQAKTISLHEPGGLEKLQERLGEST